MVKMLFIRLKTLIGPLTNQLLSKCASLNAAAGRTRRLCTSAQTSEEKNVKENVEQKKSSEKKSEKREGIFQEMKKMIIEDEEPPPPIESQSLVKGFLVNKVDERMLVYPEFGETSDVVEINDFSREVEKFLKTDLDSNAIDKQRTIPAEVFAKLKTFGLFGLEVPKDLGGLGFNNKAVLRISEELSRDWSVYSTLAHHNDLVVKAIQRFGSAEQKKTFLPRLASGESIGAFCLHEDESGQDIALMETRARPTIGSSKFVIKGKKTWITNGAAADILLVFAKLKSNEEKTGSVTFIVDRRTSSGIKTLDRKNPMGLRGSEVFDLEFDDVEVEDKNVLGYEGHGFQVATTTLGANRHVLAAAVSGFLKRLLAVIVRHCNTTKRFGVVLNDSPLVKTHIAEFVMKIYALETMAYYIAGRLDEDPKRDLAIEGAITMKEARRVLRECLLTSMELLGAESRTFDSEYERLLRDVVTLFGCMSTDEYLTGFIAMEGLKVYSNEHKSVLHKGKNAVKFPFEAAVERFMRHDLYREGYKIQHYIYEKVHPSCETACKFIEDTMAKFQHVFKTSIYTSGMTVEDEQIVLHRISEILACMFSMMAVISRSSRSYSIGLKNSTNELYTTNTYCAVTRVRCLHLLNQFTVLHSQLNEDESTKKIGDWVLRERGYPIDQPIARNW